ADFLDLRGPVFRAVMTIAVFPIASFLLGRSQRALLGAGLPAMRREALRQRLFTRRAAVLAGGQALLLAAISGRMYQLQITESERYAVLADENRISLRLLAPLRARV